MAPNGTKKIFISDIHMGDSRSQEGDHPYGWFWGNTSNLANFLDEQLGDKEVSEVVILGDLFDTWVIPTDLNPLDSFQAICDNNSPVIKALQQLAENKSLSYVPGNHDMAMSASDPDENKNFMKTILPGINYISEGVYQSGKLIAEHGHRCCLFNAIDTWTNLPSLLPIGYFITRMVAHKVSTTGKPENVLDILGNFIKKFLDPLNFNEQTFIKDIFMAIAKDTNLEDNAPINMTGISGFPPTVGDISTFYENLIENWKQNRQDVGWKSAAINDSSGDISQAAYDTYFFPSDSDKNIVIFGHTHKADLRSFNRGPEPADPDSLVDISSHAIYANCGTWVDSVESTYVEIEEDRDAGQQKVRVLTYPGKTLKREDFVEL